ncbi:MAG: Ig domain-containing protein [Acidobacteriia bacterium]|nr:Ig domain-containing protein [Terriglobia bacterium]
MKISGWVLVAYSAFLALLQIGCAGGGTTSTADAAMTSMATEVSPSAVPVGQASFVLNVRGTNFSSQSKILWNGTDLKTTFVSDGQVKAEVSSEAVAKPSVASVAVKNISTGRVSNSLPLAVVIPIKITATQMPAGQVEVPYSAPLSVTGGAAPAQWSVFSGSLPSGLAMNLRTGTVSGTPGASGNFSFTAYVTDSLGSSAKANLTINIAAVGQTSASAAGSYGPALGADSLGNTTLGPNGNMVSYRFRAKHSGVLEQTRIYLIPDHAGYAAGTGGTIQVTLHADDGTASHGPGNSVLASYTISNVLSLASPARYFYVLKFASPPSLTAGQLYHLVFKNVDASPLTNFLSVDDLCETVPTTLGQPTVSDIDSAVLLSQNGGAWSQRKSYSPIYELDFQDGASEGIGYMEAWSGAPENISGSNAIREIFTVSGSQVKVTSASIRVARVSGNDPLKVRLEHADGSIIEQGTVPAAAMANSNSSSPVHGWVIYPFSTTYTLLPGQTYHLVFEAAVTSIYQAFPIRKGSAYGFKNTTYFPDGYAEFEANNSWAGWTQWGAANRTDGDLQFYFAVAP